LVSVIAELARPAEEPLALALVEGTSWSTWRRWRSLTPGARRDLGVVLHEQEAGRAGPAVPSPGVVWTQEISQGHAGRLELWLSQPDQWAAGIPR
jgi:hypothetical protein